MLDKLRVEADVLGPGADLPEGLLQLGPVHVFVHRLHVPVNIVPAVIQARFQYYCLTTMQQMIILKQSFESRNSHAQFIVMKVFI